MFSDEDGDKKRKKKKEKKERKKSGDEGGFPGDFGGADFGTDFGGAAASGGDFGASDFGSAGLGGDPSKTIMPTFGEGSPSDDPFATGMGAGSGLAGGFGDFGSGFGDDSPKASREPRLDSMFDSPPDLSRGFGASADHGEDVSAQAFEAVLAADREVIQELRREVDRLGEQVRQEQDEGRLLQGEVQDRQMERRQLMDQERDLKDRLDAAKARLDAARKEHRGTSFEHVSLSTDRQRAAEELSFLSKKAVDDEGTMKFFAQANERLEKLNEDLSVQWTTLEQERKNLANESIRERELAKQEERQLAELRNRADRLRRGKLAMQFQEQEAHSREQYLRDVKQGNVVTGSLAGSGYNGSPMQAAFRPQARPVGSHSWASGLSSGPLGSSTSMAGPPQRATTMQRPGVGVHF